ncbi:AcrR family transcriptional regulator [Actinoplanes octamycinicus]|uniref:AcrR family transcriptional regulator n=1 Tax=Actinoplanes octamycinicus TaxID=135948 RepID=A0A7W7M9T6_9ACTN|nr:TetR/AcrR family transcriptional regulator [Actinoplanes octamycinicus]MBB4742262.1 AcrR family transcriptional regulator [Actinoplanes octamycinicus]GIE59893.1 TetR family transcriptional regulator [Actinoplanes octamycinicus]
MTRPERLTQTERRERTRQALLEAAAVELSHYGYAQVNLERVAKSAGFTRGALYHQFTDKNDLVLAVIAWSRDTWLHEVGPLVAEQHDPVAALLALARGHATFTRRNVARMPIALRMGFAGQDHPVGREVERTYGLLIERCRGLIADGQRAGSISSDTPAEVLAPAFLGALEGLLVGLASRAPDDRAPDLEALAVRTAAGVLGLSGT